MINGKRKQFVSRTPKMPGKKECRERCIEWVENGIESHNLSVEKIYYLFLDDYKKSHGENEQLRHLIGIGNNYIIPAIGRKKAYNVTLTDLQSIINNAVPKAGHKECLSRKYLKDIKGAISSFISWAAPRHYIEYIPMSQIYIPADAPTIGKDILQISDIEKWFSHPTGLWYERALMLEVLTGMRPGEILGLQKDDYDPLTGTITINRSVNARGKITPGKNDNARRVIGLPEEVITIIDQQLECTEYLDSEWIFCSRIGSMARQADMLRCCKLIATKCGISNRISPYSLRHTFYTHTEAYLPDRVIKAVFGHSAKTDGHSIYGSHRVDGEAHEAARRLSVTPLYKAAKKNEKAE